MNLKDTAKGEGILKQRKQMIILPKKDKPVAMMSRMYRKSEDIVSSLIIGGASCFLCGLVMLE